MSSYKICQLIPLEKFDGQGDPEIVTRENKKYALFVLMVLDNRDRAERMEKSFIANNNDPDIKIYLEEF